MLERPDGATIEEMVKKFQWQPHTVRGAIAGALKKKLGLPVQSEKVEGRACLPDRVLTQQLDRWWCEAAPLGVRQLPPLRSNTPYYAERVCWQVLSLRHHELRTARWPEQGPIFFRFPRVLPKACEPQRLRKPPNPVSEALLSLSDRTRTFWVRMEIIESFQAFKNLADRTFRDGSLGYQDEYEPEVGVAERSDA